MARFCSSRGRSPFTGWTAGFLLIISTNLQAATAWSETLWPWLSVLLFLLLAAAIGFCFFLQLHINRLQRRLGEQTLELEDLGQRLEEVIAEDQFRTTFFHSSSHELRTPLNGIIGFLQLTSQGQYGTLPQPVRVQLGKCVMLAESLKHQINTILDLADGRRGQLQLHNSRIPLSKLVSEIEIIAESLSLRHGDCHFEVKKLWPPDDASFINDSAKLLVILRHLVGNAYKFGKAHQRNHVTLAISKRNRALTIEVSDQGQGLNSDQISRIFNDKPMPQDGPNPSRYEERGLGLPMVRVLVRLMGGEMKISSEPGAGSKFTVVVPEQSDLHLEPPTADTIPLAHSSAGEQSYTAVHSHIPSHNLMKLDGYAAHVLVVDDNEINCEIIQEILIPQGYRVTLAYGGREALVRMRGDRPDLVLLDLTMPEFTGENVMQEKQLDSTLNDIPVILVTARASEEDRIHGLDLGADDYLTKPIIQQELVLRVRNLLSRQRLTKRVALMEEREKLAQLGELITDLSREFKDIYAERRPEVGRSLCQEAIAALPQVAQFGSGFSSIFLQDLDLTEDIELDTLPLPRTDAESLAILRAMRLQLATTALSGSEKSMLWQSLQALPLADLVLYHRITSLANAHIHLLDQSAKARLLMDGILEFHQRRGTQRLCRIDHIMQKIQSLLGPRLRVTGVRLDMVISEDTLLIHPADLMQVGIGLITTLCHRLEMLLDQDKWLKITTQSRDDMLLLRFTCGGPKLTEVQALHLFDPATEGNEASPASSGLHVARRIVQRAPGRLDFNLGESTTCFELELPRAAADSL